MDIMEYLNGKIAELEKGIEREYKILANSATECNLAQCETSIKDIRRYKDFIAAYNNVKKNILESTDTTEIMVIELKHKLDQFTSVIKNIDPTILEYAVESLKNANKQEGK